MYNFSRADCHIKVNQAGESKAYVYLFVFICHRQHIITTAMVLPSGSSDSMFLVLVTWASGELIDLLQTAAEYVPNYLPAYSINGKM